MPDRAGEPPALPHQFDHRHSDVSGGWLRAATFGAMDGLVSNTALIAGVAAGAGAHTVVLSGIAGLLAGSFSMALGEYTSVTTANEQIDSEVRVEKRALQRHPREEAAELVGMLMALGMSEGTARSATEEIHRDPNRAVNFHLVQEIGVDPTEKPSPWVAAFSSFLMFAVGAVVPLIPYLLGVQSLWPGLACGGVGLLVAGALAARFTRKAGVVGVVAPTRLRLRGHRRGLRRRGVDRHCRRLTSNGRRAGAGVVENAVQQLHGRGQRPAFVGVESGEIRVDDGRAVFAHPLEGIAAGGRYSDADGAGVIGIGCARDQSGRFEPSNLHRHRGLRTVVERGEIGDARLALVLDGRQQSRLRRRQRHPGALRRQPVEPGHGAEQVGAQSALGSRP